MTEEVKVFPTGKQHVSFSEVKCWDECSYRHKLIHVDKIDLFKQNEFVGFGTAVHSSCENFLKTGIMDTEIAVKYIDEFWTEYQLKKVGEWKKQAVDILKEIPDYLNQQFPGWSTVSAEELLYENIEGIEDIKFKGYVDAIIKVPTEIRGKIKDLYWIIDFKTSNFGWTLEKKQDQSIRNQLVYYKNFWSKKANIPFQDIRCGFMILKRTAKQGNKCDFFSVSVGDKTSGRSLKVLNNMISSVKKGVAIKNRESCKYCDFNNTDHCKSF